MTRLLSALLLSLLWPVFPGCASPVSSEPVEIRVENASAVVMEAIRVDFQHEEVEYGTLAPGEATDYRTVGVAYRIASVEATIGGEVQRMQIVDYVGERPLAGGRYTYRLGLFEGTALTLELVED